MLYTLVLGRNKPYSNLQMTHLPEEVGKAWNEVFSEETFAKYGVKWVVYCDTAWANEEYNIFAINSYKDIPSRIAHWKEIEKAYWYQYADLTTLMGTTVDEPRLPDFPNPIYLLYMIRSDPAAAANLARETKEEEAARWAKWEESMRRVEACEVIYCDSYWANNEYLGFGVIAFPSIEAQQSHIKDLLELRWNQYYSAFTLLGTSRF